MAGMGKRMRPHTLTVPKPLIPVAGKPVVQRLVEDIAAVCNDKIEEVAFIIGRFGKETEDRLIAIANSLGAKGTIYYQDEALGTAHAIYCAEQSLSGKVIVAFADTLFRAEFKLNDSSDSIIWVHKVKNPSSFGVVKVSSDNVITDFIEKPKEFISDLAIIGIYYFKSGELLKAELKYLLDNNITVKGEFQLTDALENMKNKNLVMTPGEVAEWLDCGNKENTVYTNQRVLENTKSELPLPKNTRIENSIIIQPCFIGDNSIIENSIIGPHVSIGAGSKVSNSIVKNSIVMSKVTIENTSIENSMAGNNSIVQGKTNDINISDFSAISL